MFCTRGKSFAIAEFMKDSGKIYSRDIYGHKLDLIKAGAKRLGLKSIETEQKDASKDNSGTKADYVLVDAPCSGFGLVRKNLI